jgi:AcrR family transcriptional regulator
MGQKDENYWSILNTAIALDVRHGHLKWTMMALSRQSKVSRTLIYYYFGKSKLTILSEAVNLFGSEFAGQTSLREEQWKSGHLAETFLASRKLIEKLPTLLPFYFSNRGKDNDLGRAIQSHEKDFLSKVKRFFPHLSNPERLALYGIFWGLVFAPGLSEEALREGVAKIHQIMGAK